MRWLDLGIGASLLGGGIHPVLAGQLGLVGFSPLLPWLICHFLRFLGFLGGLLSIGRRLLQCDVLVGKLLFEITWRFLFGSSVMTVRLGLSFSSTYSPPSPFFLLTIADCAPRLPYLLHAFPPPLPHYLRVHQ
jgi:hypothetical protein